MTTLRVICILFFISTIALSTIYIFDVVQTALSHIEEEMHNVNKHLQYRK